MKNINEMDSHVNQNESSNQVSGKVRRSFRRFIRVAIVLLLLVGGAFFYVRYYFVFGSGVKAGTLNYVVKKGYVFKTYEGILIMEGFRTESRGTLYNPQIQISEKSQTKRIEIADSRKTKRPKIDKRTTHNKRHSNAIITL